MRQFTATYRQIDSGESFVRNFQAENLEHAEEQAKDAVEDGEFFLFVDTLDDSCTLEKVQTAIDALDQIRRDLEIQMLDYAENAGHLPEDPQIRKDLDLFGESIRVADEQANEGMTTPAATAFRRWESVVSTGATLSSYRWELQS